MQNFHACNFEFFWQVFLQNISFCNFARTIVFWYLYVLELKPHACRFSMLQMMLFLSLGFFRYKVVSYAIWQNILYNLFIFPFSKMEIFVSLLGLCEYFLLDNRFKLLEATVSFFICTFTTWRIIWVFLIFLVNFFWQTFFCALT